MKIKRTVSTHLVWKCQSATGKHHPYYNLARITITKMLGGKVEIYFDIHEADEGDGVPTDSSRVHLRGMERKLDALVEKGVLDAVNSNILFHWPHDLRIQFHLKNGERFIKSSLAMCLRILDVLEARYPSAENISVEHRTIFEVFPGYWVPEPIWITLEARHAIETHQR